MTRELILAIDQGTTTTRAIAYDFALRPLAAASRPISVRHPRPGWVEQDAEEILASVVDTVAEARRACAGDPIVAAGLDNQGETVVAWDAESGRSLAPAIVWQCRRSGPIMERLRAAGHEDRVRRRTGLPLDPYFSAGKMTWLLEEVPAVAAARDRGALRLGTVDAWLTWHLAGEALTDPSTASRTQLFGLAELAWSQELLDIFGVPEAALPRVVPSAGRLAELSHREWGGAVLPLTAMACDQQAALAGHGCFHPGGFKATYGTGVFVLAAAGREPPRSGDRMLATVAWQLPGAGTTYALDGGVFSAGGLLNWLRDGLGLLRDPADAESVARRVPDSAGVTVLPAQSGLGAPWWRPEARTVIAGLTGAATASHVVRAALDGIAHRVADVVEVMADVLDAPPPALRIDGGLAGNAYLVERQADLLGIPVHVAAVEETTALGAAGLAGIGAGLLDEAVIVAANPPARTVVPRAADAQREAERTAWREFVFRAAGLTGTAAIGHKQGSLEKGRRKEVAASVIAGVAGEAGNEMEEEGT